VAGIGQIHFFVDAKLGLVSGAFTKNRAVGTMLAVGIVKNRKSSATDIADVLPGRIEYPNEYNIYYTTLSSNHFLLLHAPRRRAIQKHLHLSFISEFIARRYHHQIPRSAILTAAINFKISVTFQNVITKITFPLADCGFMPALGFNQNKSCSYRQTA
jgi:hypothetical protein